MSDIELTVDKLAGHIQKTVDTRLLDQVADPVFKECCGNGHKALHGVGHKTGRNGPG